MRAVLLSVAALVLAGCGSAEPVAGGGRPAAGVSAVQAPLPATAGVKGHYNVGLTDVACAAPGSCAATGYLDSNTVSRGLLFVEKNGAWSVSEPPLPQVLRPGNKSETVSSVDCPAAGRCVAVGMAASGQQLVPLVFTQGPHGWRQTVAPLPAGVDGGILDFVSCPAAGSCTAAGTYLLDESNGKWTPSKAELPPNGSATTSGEPPVIQDLACASPGECSAVGLYGDEHGSPQGWLLDETHGAWAEGVEAQLPANASTQEGSYLYPVIDLTVSCVPDGDCTAVGGYGDRRSNQFGMILSEHGGHWGPAQQAPLPANAGPNPQQGNFPRSPLGSVACPAAGSCSAVGWYLDDKKGYHGLLLREQDGTWSPSSLVIGPGAFVGSGSLPGISLDSVACPSAGNCLAVGEYNPSPSRLRPLLVPERDGSWGKGTEAPPPAGAAKGYNGSLSSVSCPSARVCVAVGNTTSAGYLDQRGLIVTIRRR